ncbi:MAG: S-layer family protein [Cyanobacteria bacterium J06634_6]
MSDLLTRLRPDLIGNVWYVGLGASALVGTDVALNPGKATAQVSGDGSFATLVNGSLTDSCRVATCQIEGGQRNDAGNLLFHSFDEFSPGQVGPQSVLFVDPGVSDIIVRVTGGESFINGLLQTSTGSNANVFVVNPGGIRFGGEAVLAIGGSFTASTASEILFDGGVTLASGSSNPATAALLTVSTPIGLGFLPGSQTGSIDIAGNGNRFLFNDPQFVERRFQTSQPTPLPFPPFTEVAVQPGNDIAIIGNGVSLSGGNVAALGGQIAIASIESGNVFFWPERRTTDNPTGNLDYTQVAAFSDITLDDRASLDVSAGRAGSVSLRGRNITVAGGSGILAETLALPGSQPVMSSDGGLLDIAATDLILITNPPDAPDPMGLPLIFSYLAADVGPGAAGPGGRINVSAQNLTIENGAQIGANTFGSGNAGEINIDVEENLTLREIGTIGVSGLFSATTAISTGNAGLINIDTGSLTIEQGATIDTRALGSPGASGTIDIDARQTVSILGVSRPIEIFDLDTGSFVTASLPSSIETNSGVVSVRQGGGITVDAGRLLVREGGAIASVTEGAAAGGSIAITAQSAEISGVSNSGPSVVTTTTVPGSTGNGGGITLDIDRLSVVDIAQVSTGTSGSGSAGNLVINSDEVFVSGVLPNIARSGVFTSAINGVGDGGNLTVNTDTLRVSEGGTFSVSNFSSLPGPFPPGQGSAGNLEINASEVRLESGAVLNASTAEGDRGNITINTTDVLALSGESLIAADAGGSSTGGNVTINSPTGFVVTTPEDNSDITANAVLGDGGQVNITARSVLGIEPRPALTAFSDITASSEFGVAGETRVDAVDSEVPEEPSPLPEPVEIEQVAQGCNTTDGAGRFVQTGRGGVGASPYGVLNSRGSLPDVSVPSSLRSVVGTATENGNGAQQAESASSSITEAQGWAVDGSGDVVLLAADEYVSDRCLSWRS